ncbi:MAG TPA: PspC domain-containing protein [Candidatus Polarisedimenticolia bacterium]|jgi:phage shock protein C
MPGRRLYRSRADRKIAGVCGGIAEYFDIDPVFVRIAAFLLTFPHGLGIIAYLICWAAIPQRSEETGAPAAADPAAPESGVSSTSAGPAPSPSQAYGGGELLAGGALIAAGLFFLLLNLGIFDWEIFRYWRWRLVWPLLVIGLGIYIVSTSLSSRPGRAGRGRP